MTEENGAMFLLTANVCASRHSELLMLFRTYEMSFSFSMSHGTKKWLFFSIELTFKLIRPKAAMHIPLWPYLQKISCENLLILLKKTDFNTL